MQKVTLWESNRPHMREYRGVTGRLVVVLVDNKTDKEVFMVGFPSGQIVPLNTTDDDFGIWIRCVDCGDAQEVFPLEFRTRLCIDCELERETYKKVSKKDSNVVNIATKVQQHKAQKATAPKGERKNG